MKAIAKVLTGLVFVLLVAGAAQPAAYTASGTTAQSRTSREVVTPARPPAPAKSPDGDLRPVGAGAEPARATKARSVDALSGPQPFVTILCKFADVKDEPATPAYFEELLATAHRGLDAYWREASYDRINLDGSRVMGWYTLPQPASAYRSQASSDADLERLAMDCTAAADGDVFFPDYVGINLVFNYDGERSPAGGTRCLELDGRSRCYGVTWVWSAWIRDQAGFAHEMGHAFGLPHSSAGRDEEYGNLWDVMSNSGPCKPDPAYDAVAQHMIAYQKDQLGWIPPGRKFVALPQDETTITLERLALPQSDGYLMVQIPIAGSESHFYTVEARRRVSYDTHLPADAVVIHEVETTRPAPAHLVSRRGASDTSISAGLWTVGSLFADPAHGIAVSIDAQTATGFVVTIFTRPLPWLQTPAHRARVLAGDVLFAWHPVPGATGYQLQIEPQSAFSPALRISRTLDVTEQVIALSSGTYRWRVQALPVGEWTLFREVEVTDAGLRWLPSELIPVFTEVTLSRLAIAADSAGNVCVAYGTSAENRTGMTSGAIHMVHRFGGVWQSLGLLGDGMGGGAGATPAIALSLQGDVYAVWTERSDLLMGIAANTDIWFADRQAGGDWGTAIRVNDSAWPAIRSNPVIAMDSAGNIYTLWQEMRNSDSDIYFAYRPAGGLWEANVRVNDDATTAFQWSPTLAVDAQGNAYAAWVDARHGRTDIYVAYRPAGGGWEANTRLSKAGLENYASPTIAVDGQGNTYAAWASYCSCGTAKGSVGEIESAFRPAGRDWGPVTVIGAGIDGADLLKPAITGDENGGAYIVWAEQNGSGFELYSAHRPAGGTWSPKVRVSDNAGNTAPAQPAITVDAAGNAYVVWSDSSGEVPRLRFSVAMKRAK